VVGEWIGFHASTVAKAGRHSFPAVLSVFGVVRLFAGIQGILPGSRASRPSSPENAAVVDEREVAEAVIGEWIGFHASTVAKAGRHSFPALLSVFGVVRLFAGIQGILPFFSRERCGCPTWSFNPLPERRGHPDPRVYFRQESVSQINERK
jgi:hypothetical protein